MEQKAFAFLPMPERPGKPRVQGITMVIDTGVGYGYCEDLLKICADYVDVWKLGWATTQLQPLSIVQKKIDLLRDHQIQVSNGGTLLELAEHQGKSLDLFKELVDMGCDSAEISSGSLEISCDRICQLIASARDFGLIPYCEVGKKLPENDLSAAEFNRQIMMFLKAGAEKVIVEARESGASVGFMDSAGNPKAEKVRQSLEGVPIDRVLLEAPRKAQQVFFMRTFGAEVNLGNIAPTDIISVETLRRGLRGDTVNDFYLVIGERHLAKRGEI